MVQLPVDLNSASKEVVKEFLDSFDTIFTDCDGVLWLGNKVIDGANTTLNKFRELGKPVFYVTNNSSRTREEFVTKCEKLGFKAEWKDIISTAYLAAEYLSGIKFSKKAYVIGSNGMTQELTRFGIKHTAAGPDIMESNLRNYIGTKMSLDDEVGAVLVGFDEHFSYPKLLKAANYLKNKDCLFVATNADENLTVDHLLIPGTGSIVKALETATGRKAYVIGKPNDYIKNVVEKSYSFNPEKTLMIGDRCSTDILFGKRCGFQTLLVLSGVTSYEEVKKFAASPDPADNELVPRYCINKLGDLWNFIS